MPRRKTKTEEPVIADIRNPEPAPTKQEIAVKVKKVEASVDGKILKVLNHLLEISKVNFIDTFRQFLLSKEWTGGLRPELLNEFKFIFQNTYRLHGIDDQVFLDIIKELKRGKGNVKSVSEEYIKDVFDSLNDFFSADSSSPKKEEPVKKEKASTKEPASSGFFNDLNIL